MNRRDFLQGMAAAIVAGTFAPKALAQSIELCAVRPGDRTALLNDYMEKMRHFDAPHHGDLFVPREQRPVFTSCVKRLGRVEQTVGGGNFRLLCWDEALSQARDYASRIGEFPKAERDFMEGIFYADATRYGFFGEKSLRNITDRIPIQEVTKVPHSGNYLYKGRPLETFERIQRDVGEDVILTSGVRGVMKQFLLFFRKAYANDGNLSLASRSLAPPGYSFHGISDFDIGQIGLGLENFTSHFAETNVYRRLKQLDYLNLRYPADNLVGVRFEPWHIKVDSHA